MSSQFIDLPTASVIATNPSIGSNGNPIPTSSTQISGENPGGNVQPLQTDNAGNLLISINAEPDTPLNTKDVADGTPGAPVPATAIQVGGSDGTDLRTLLTDNTGKLEVAAIAGALPAGTNILGKVGIDQTTPGATNAVSIADIGATTVATGNGVSGAGTMRVNIASDNSAIAVTTTATDITASGSITTQNLNPNSGVATAGSTVAITLNGQSVLSIQVTGVYTGALTPQATVDGSDWVAISSLMNVNTGAFAATITSASTGIFQVGVSAFKQFRISANAAVTGTATISIQASIATGQVAIDVPLPAGTNNLGSIEITNGTSVAAVKPASTAAVAADPALVVALSPNNNSLANALLIKATDGTNTAAVKAASTAPVAADPALVVAVSPNSPLKTSASQGTLTDNSGTTSGTPSTSTTLMASNANRKYLFIQNTSLSNTIWINFTTAATTAEPSIQLLPGSGFSQEANYVSTEAITVISTATSSPYAAKQG